MWSTTTSTNSMEDTDKIAVFMPDNPVPSFFVDRNDPFLLTKLKAAIVSIEVNIEDIAAEDIKQLLEESEKIVVKDQCVKKTPVTLTQQQLADAEKEKSQESKMKPQEKADAEDLIQLDVEVPNPPKQATRFVPKEDDAKSIFEEDVFFVKSNGTGQQGWKLPTFAVPRSREWGIGSLIEDVSFVDPTPAKMNICHVNKDNLEQKSERPKVCYICKNIPEEKFDQSEHYTQECNFLIKIKNPEAKMNMIDKLSLCRTCLARHRGQCRNSKKKCDCCGQSGHHRMLCPTNLPGTGNGVKNDKIQVPPKRHRKRKPSISSSSSSSIASSNSTNYFELTARIFKEAKGKKIQNGLESSSKETTPTTTDSETSEDFEKEQKESSQDEVNGDDTYSDFDNVEEGSKDISRSDEASSSGKGDDSDPDKNTDSD